MSPEVLARIREILPVAGGRNPIDTTAQVGGRMHVFEGISQAMMQGAELGSVIFYLAHVGRNIARFPPLEKSLVELRRNFPDRLVVAVMTYVDEIRLRLESLGIPVFEDPTRAVKAIRGAARVRALQAAAVAPPDLPSGPALGLSVTNEAAAKAVLARAGAAGADLRNGAGGGRGGSGRRARLRGDHAPRPGGEAHGAARRRPCLADGLGRCGDHHRRAA
jgi:acyl-CoA synthetase (NDP forming)